MLLHKFYINVAIANVLLYQITLYNLPGRKFKNWGWHKTPEGCCQNSLIELDLSLIHI